jgi:Pvc16 N-terminal domain
MSGPLAIGAVSAILRNLLDDGLVNVAPAVGSVTVTAVAPDTVKLDDPDAGPSINLFLYRVSPNQGWRNAALPAYDANGSRLANPPLALDLHFLLTAYGNADFHAEILLGYAMAILHERPVLDRAAIRRALSPSPLGASILPPAFQALAAADLADQLEAVTVTLEPMDTEEMSRLWSAIQAHYRPTAGYLVSVVLIEPVKPTRSSLPVLSRGAVDPITGEEAGVFVQPDLQPPLPTLFAVVPPGGQPAARLGETVRLAGVHLDGSALEVEFAHPLLDAPRTIAVGVNTDPTGLDVTLPSGSAANQQWPAGVWVVTVRLVRPGEAVTRTTSAAAMVLAPVPVLVPAPTMVRDAGTGGVTVTLGVRPRVRPGQRATLALGSDVAIADAHPTTTATLTFRFGPIPDGTQWVRLTVDGAESRLVNRATEPPSFDPSQRVMVPA